MMMHRLAMIASSLTALSAAVGLAGAVVPAFDALNHFAPFLFLGSTLSFAAALRWGGALSALAALAGMVPHGLLIFTAVLPVPMQAPGAEASQTITVATFNVWGRNPTPGLSGEYLNGSGADIIVLQELRPTTRTLIEAAGFAHRYDCTELAIDCHIAILSRHPFVAPVRSHCGIALSATVDTPQLGTITVVGVHLSRPWPPGRQEGEMRCLISEIERLDAQTPTVILGDLNATPWSFSLRRFDSGLPDFNRVTRASATWPAAGARVSALRLPSPFAMFPIDHVYLGESLSAISVRRGPMVGSDHLPLFVQLGRAHGAEHGAVRTPVARRR